MSKRSTLIRIDLGFKEKYFDEIRKLRLINGMDKTPVSDRRLSVATRRHPLIKKIKEDIIKSRLEENNDYNY